MKSLVFDTCFNKTYIVLSENNKIIENVVIESNEQNYHSAYLIPRLRDILIKNNILIKDIDVMGIDIGPGSFTGIRAGITIARVLAQQFNTKLVGVPSLEILSKLNQGDNNTVVTTDARKNKVYFAKYKNGLEIVKPCLIDKDELVSKISSDEYVITDRSISAYLNENSVLNYCYEDNDSNIGIYLSEITNEYINNKSDDYNWAKVKPLYIQKPSITLPKAVKSV
ncbi:tRNA (adenosine(37)-N6)-threonylcarbamoyltransferase complex dimerization subunit type 1 TsaB [bacterium]|nr:tRNA (adenosine(37)-N6)-threonylcarbamoyltransferase complex dimerization subunit type 1 TsaB [bacterium]